MSLTRYSFKNLIGALIAFAALCLAAPQQASAQTCSATMTDVTFAGVDLTQNTPYDTTANWTATCTGGTPGQQLHVCINLGAGTGGASGANAPRYLKHGGNDLGYNLFLDSGRTAVWGSYTGGGNPKELVMTLDTNGADSASGSLYARIFSGQQSLPTGSYQSNFNGGQASVSFDVESGQDCTGVGGSNASNFNFQASATYSASCTLSVNQTMNFGTITDMTQITDASATLSAVCSASSPYTIAMGAGLNSTGPLQRNMKSGQNSLAYHLYKDAARTDAWGATGGLLQSGSGSGGTQNYTVFGRVPANQLSPPGTYNDTVIVTLTY